MNNPKNDQENPDDQEKSIDLTVIGDIVSDKIVFDENEEKAREYLGGALFVKKFLECDPAINSLANIYGYEKIEDNSAEPGDGHYSIKINEQINTITLKLQETKKSDVKVYRSHGLTKTEISSNDKSFTVKAPKAEQNKKNLSILIVTDLGVSSDSSQSLHGISRRKIELRKDDSSQESVYEWECHLRAAYEANNKREEDKNNAMPWHFINISNPTESLFERGIYQNFKRNMLFMAEDKKNQWRC